jgi:fatty-acyl-CoA synthase
VNLGLLLSMAADGFGHRVAIGSRAAGITYEQLCADAAGLSSELSERDPSHTVFLGLNSPAFPTALFASAFAGIPFVPLNYRLADEQLASLLQRTAPAVAVIDPDMAHRVEGFDGIEVARWPDGPGVAERDAGAREGADSEAAAVLLFTSGTTGDPKAALLRHRHLTAYILESVDFMGADEDECALISVPPYHIAAISAVLSCVYAGRRCVLLDQFDAERWVALVRDEGVTHAMVVPTMLARIVEVLDGEGGTLPSLRHLAYGGGRMSVDLIERALHLLPEADFVNAYGLTETSSTIALLNPEDHRAALGTADPRVRARLGSVGRPLPAVELEVRDADGLAVGSGVSGEIHVRGPQISGEYVGQSRLSGDGWFATHDSGYVDEDGYLFVEGRLDDVIVRGGENISPGEIEAVLVSHPAVIEAAVVGIPDEEWGEQIAAAVVAEERNDEDLAHELRDLVRRELRSTRVPGLIDFRASLPYNETGKLLRRQLRADLSAANEAQATR